MIGAFSPLHFYTVTHYPIVLPFDAGDYTDMPNERPRAIA